MCISVVMATYNGDKYLRQQISSIVDQSLPPDEIIVCDDISADTTTVILKEYQNKQLLKYTVNSQRLGLIGNFKKAASLAKKNNYIAFCDQDDEWMPDKLQRGLKLLKSIEQDGLPCMVYSDLLYIDENDVVINNSFRNEYGQDKYQHNLQTLLFSNFVTGCTILMNAKMAEFFLEMPNDARFHDEWIALTAFTFGKAASIDEPLVRYRKHSNNLSIAANTKPRNRYRSVLGQIKKAITGQDDFLSTQFEVIKKFYKVYGQLMPTEKRQIFEGFLSLETENYFIKKLAFRKIVKQYAL